MKTLLLFITMLLIAGCEEVTKARAEQTRSQARKDEWPFHNGHAKKLNDSTMVYRWFWYDTISFCGFINDSIFLLDLDKVDTTVQ